MTPNMRIVVNGDTWMDGNLGQWEQKQPTQFVEAMKNPRNQTPGLKALMIAVADGAARNKSLNINLQHTPTSWTLTVEDA